MVEERAGGRDAALVLAGIATGLSVAAIVGFSILLVCMWRRREETSATPLRGPDTLFGLPSSPPLYLAPVDGGRPVAALQSQSQAAVRSKLDAGISYATTMNSLQISDTLPPRIFTAAGERHWSVSLRVVSPPGAFAAFSTNYAELLRPGLVGEALIVPVGEAHAIRLKPKDVLYAKGSTPGVIITLAASEDGIT